MRLKEKERYGYNRYLDSLHLKASEAFSLKIKYKEEGREEGRKEGREEGREEEKMEIAKNLLKLGLDVEFIKKSTGLSEQEIKSLQ